MAAACGGAEEEAHEEVALEPAVDTDAVESPEEADEPTLLAASHGGTVVAVGAHFLEVLVRRDGTIGLVTRNEAFPAASEVQLTTTITGADGEPHSVLLTWDPAPERYRGRMRSALPIPGAIEVKLVHGTQTYRGSSPTVVVSAPMVPPAVSVRALARPLAQATAEESDEGPADGEAEPEDAPAPTPTAIATPPVLGAARTGGVDMANRRGRAVARPADSRTRTVLPGQARVRVRE